MARKSKIEFFEKSEIEDNIIEKDFIELIDDRFTNYAFAVMEDRALPDARDGLKPSQRRTLVAMDDLNLRSSGKTKKCAKICGDVSGNYHPHGEAVVYPTLVRMAQDWSLRYPLISPQGNFGSPAPEDKPAAMRYCLTGDSLVYTNRGLMRIDKISEDEKENIDITVISVNNKLNKASKWFDSGEHPTIKITTVDNFSITGTHNHPVLTFAYENGKIAYYWKTLDLVKEGDYIVLSRNSIYPVEYLNISQYKPEFGSKNKLINLPDILDENLACIMGAIVAEGHIDSKRFGFTNLHGDLLDAFKYAMDITFGQNAYHTFERIPVGWSQNPYVSVEMHNMKTCEFLNELGLSFNKIASKKSIPWSILQSPKSVVTAFLSALYEGDGCAEINSKTVTYNTKSKLLCDQLQIVLLGLGITSKLSFSKSRNIYKIIISGKNDLNNFRSEINFLSARKQSLLNMIIDDLKDKKNCSTHNDYIPFISSFLRDKLNKSWIKKNNFDRYNNFKLNIAELKQNLDSELFSVIEQINNDNYFYQRVESVENAGINRVYSIKVDSDCHSFVSNGIINHNTEAKFSIFGDQMVSELSNQVVDYQPNYNDELMEPVVLPSLLPNLIVNGCSGIAVGWATSMAPHNLREVANLIAAYIKDPELSVEEIMTIMPGPDFPTPCKILGTNGINSYFSTGRGTVHLEGYYTLENDKNQQYIKVTGLPYGGSAEGFCREIKDLVESKKIEGITNLKNLSNKKGMDVRVWVHRNANSNVVLNLILKHTCLRTNFSVNSTVLLDGKKVVENVPMLKLVEVFVNHRKDVITKKFNAELDKNKKRIHILDGLIGITNKIDAVIKLIRNADNREIAQQQLISEKFVDSVEQAEAVLKITLGNLTKLDVNGMTDEHSKLTKRNGWLEEQLASETKMLKLISKEQLELADKIGDDRRSEIVPSADDFNYEDLIEEEQIVVSLTKDGYIKRVPLDTFKSQGRGGKGVIAVRGREEDEASDIFVGSTHDLFLFFTNKGNLLKKKGYEIPLSTRTNKGIHTANLLALEPEEVVSSTITMKSMDVDGYFVMGTRKGLIKRSEIRDYNTSLRKRGLKAITLNEGDELIHVDKTDGSKDIMLITSNGMAVRYSEDVVRSIGRTGQGVQSMKLAEDDTIVSILTLAPNQSSEVMIITENGYGKKTNADEYRTLNGRMAKGTKTINVKKSDRNGLLAGAAILTEDKDILVLTQKGKMGRFSSEDFRSKGKTTAGNIVMDVSNGDKVQKIVAVNNLSKGEVIV